MEEVPSSQYAIQIAVHTLRDRCKNLQQRVAMLEEENINLRMECSRHEQTKHSLNELDCLRAQVAVLSEQKDQLQSKVIIVTNENQDLWSKLSKLTRMNKSLGSQLTKINDTLTQHITPTNPLIRSKTFTKSELQTKVLHKNLDENDKISLELEDISLKLSDSFTKQKKELDLLCSEISEMTFSTEDLTTENCGFLLDEDLENDMFLEIQAFGEDLKLLKDVVVHQQTVLELNVKNMKILKDKLQCKSCPCQKPKIEKETSTIDLRSVQDACTATENSINNDRNQSNVGRQTNSINRNDDYRQLNDRICPLCSKVFPKEVDFEVFQRHVEDHFTMEADDYEIL